MGEGQDGVCVSGTPQALVRPPESGVFPLSPAPPHPRSLSPTISRRGTAFFCRQWGPYNYGFNGGEIVSTV